MHNLLERNDTIRILHEAFVANNTGTTPAEVVLCLMPWILATFLNQLLHSWKILEAVSLLSFLFEFKFGVFPMLLIITSLSDYLIYFTGIGICIISAIIAIKVIHLGKGRSGLLSDKLECLMGNPDSSQFCFIDNVRGHLCIISCMAILGVDFPFYPRRFGKTEYHGYGIMDLGVGFFMVLNGMVSPEARNKIFPNRWDSLKKSLTSSVPLIVIGFIRIISVKSLNYQEHVTEYGVHWNFFFSLVSARIGTSLVFTFTPREATGIIAAFIAISYQSFLHLGLRDIIFYGIDGLNSRSNLIDANREGLAASVGFVCLYLAGVQMGYFIFKMGLTIRAWLRGLGAMLITTLVFGVLTGLSHYYIELPSRRLVNLTYILEMVAATSFLCTWYMLLDFIDVLIQYLEGKQQEKYCAARPSLLNKSMNYNFLLCFLFANLLTGLINLSVDTIFVDDYYATLICGTYTFVVLGLTVLLYKMKYQLKFW